MNRIILVANDTTDEEMEEMAKRFQEEDPDALVRVIPRKIPEEKEE